MRAVAVPVTERTANGTEVPKVEFRFTISFAQLRGMSPEEVVEKIALMSRPHAYAVVEYANRHAPA